MKAKRFPKFPAARAFIFLSSVLVLLAAGCRLNYGTDVEADELAADVPNVEIFGFSQEIYQDGRLVLELQAETSRAFESRNQRELELVSFTEYDADGEVSARGSADKAILFTDTENVELTGNIEVYSQKEGASVIGGYFYWDSEGRTITSLVEELVQISTDDGEEVSGRGFTANMRRRTVSFSQGVEGRVGDDQPNDDQSIDDQPNDAQQADNAEE